MNTNFQFSELTYEEQLACSGGVDPAWWVTSSVLLTAAGYCVSAAAAPLTAGASLAVATCFMFCTAGAGVSFAAGFVF